MQKVIPDDAVLVPDTAVKAFSGEIFDVCQWPQKLYDGSEHTFEMLKRADTVSVIAIVDDKILVIDDTQPHLGTRQSFPGGRVDDSDETIQAAAEREMQEETGYRFQNWRLIKVSQPYRKIEWFVYVWLAWGVVEQTERHLDPGEKITVHELPFDEVKTRVMNHEGYLAESSNLFESLQVFNDLLALPEFTGQTIDR
jgi:ADP-ribose pyrophosphatase YjhB (NUDIX family)